MAGYQCGSAEKSGSKIYIVPALGGTPRLVTPVGPSYWHGWSPDGKALTFCGQRHGDYDVYTVPERGRRGKTADHRAGLDDGPEYTSDGKKIYFQSDAPARCKFGG